MKTTTKIAAAIANGTAIPDLVFNDWEVNTILAGFAREVIADAEDNIPDTRSLCSLLGVIAEDLAVSPFEFLRAENRRTTYRSETRRTVKPDLPELEDLPDEMVFRAAEVLAASGALKYKAAALALFKVFHLEADDVAELARRD